jgi:hypothetical protein
MGTEIRMVPENWEHPKDKLGHYIPLYGISYEEAANKWIDRFNSFKPDFFCKYYWEYCDVPLEEEHVKYTKDQQSWYQVYENISEGTPITPPFETKEALINYLYSCGDYDNSIIDYIKELLRLLNDKN